MKQLSTFFAMLLVSMLLIGSSTFAQTTTTWTNTAGDQLWSNAGNWSAGLPTAAIDAVIDVSKAAPIVDGAVTCQNLTFTGTNASYAGITFTGGPLTITGDIDLTGGKIVAGTGAITIEGSWTLGTGTFAAGTSTVTFDGATAQTITDINTFYNIVIDNAVSVALSQTITVARQISVTATGVFDDNGQTVKLTGTFGTPLSVAGGGTYTSTGTLSFENGVATTIPSQTYNNLNVAKSGVTFTAAGALVIDGNFSIGTGTTFIAGAFTHTVAGNFTNDGTFTQAGSTMEFNGTDVQSVAGMTYNNLHVSNTDAVVSLNSTAQTTVAGTLTLDAGAVLSDNGNQMGTITTLVSAGTLMLGNATATVMPTVTTNTTPGTVEFAATVAQTVDEISNSTYDNIVLSGSGTKTLSGNLDLEGQAENNFTIGSGVTFDDGGNQIIIDGNWNDNGTYTASGEVVFSGAIGTTIPSETFANLSTLGSVGTLTADGDVTVNELFTLGAGDTFDDGGNTLFIGGTFDNTAGATYTTTGGVNFFGTGPMTIANTETFNDVTVSGAGTVTPAGNVTVGGDFNVNAGVFDADANAITVTLDGNFSNAGTFTGDGADLVFNGTSVVTITTPVVVNNMTVNAAHSATFMGSNGIEVTTAVLVNGTLYTGMTTVNGDAGGATTFTLAATGTLGTANVNGFNATDATTGAILMGGGAVTYTPNSSFVYNGTAAQNTGGALYGLTVTNLTINNAAGVTLYTGTLGSTTTILATTGSLTLTSGMLTNSATNLVMGDAATITLKNGTLAAAPVYGVGNTVDLVYTNTTARSTGLEIPTASTGARINDLTTGAGQLTLASSPYVTGTLALGGVLVSTGANTLAMTTGSAITGASLSKYVEGKLAWGYPIGAQSSMFPIATGGIYRPVTISMTATAAGTILVDMVNESATGLGYDLTADDLSKVSNVRYYEVSAYPTAPTGAVNGIITLTYGPDDGVNDNTNLRVASDQGAATGWFDLGGVGTANTTGAIVSTVAIASADLQATYALGNLTTGSNYLPVELTSFYGTTREENIALSWTTATEVNSSKFIVERKAANLENWAEVGEVQAAGNSNAPKTYSFVDKSASGATSFDYRLSYVDVNGKTIAFGKTISVDAAVPESFSLSQNYPNPFNPSTVIKYALPQAAHVSIRIYNMLGQEVATIVNQQADKGFYKVTWDGRTSTGNYAASGVYIYRIIAGNFVQTKKMNLLK